MGLALVPERRELFGSHDGGRQPAARRLPRVRPPSAAAAAARRSTRAFRASRSADGQLAGTLSGGERQMLAMGRALMGRPRLLMLDEPSLGLAPLIVRDIFEIIVGLKATGVSILLVEQNARAALQVADHAYVMELGEITAAGRRRRSSPPTRASWRATSGWVA